MLRARASRAALVAAAVVIVALTAAAALGDPPPPIPISLDGHAVYVPGGSTLGGLVETDHLTPARGSMVSVTGRPLRVGIYPGHIEVNGRPGHDLLVLAAHDRVRVVNGIDRREPVMTAIEATRRPADPEYTLGRAPGNLVVETGKISGEVAGTAFHPTGPVQTPKAVALTFDDGPWPGSTRAILRILRRKHVTATFFLIGDQANRDQNLVRAELRAGMRVEDHSWDHPLTPPLAEQSPRKIHDEIVFAANVERRLGDDVTLFRPPGGSWSDQMVAMANRMGMRIVLWSVDPRDWAPGATAAGITHNVLSHARRGSIVLMHDGGGDRTATVKALPRIIKGLRHRGFRLVPVER
jgi:peptidoglycan/xylan/chitin deacetylase (PgdA/CDA1 family)